MENWKKVLHVESSMEAKEGQFAMFIGRFQPLHLAHQELFSQAMNEGKNVLICIRNGQVNEKNPFNAEQVKENIENHRKVEQKRTENLSKQAQDLENLLE